MKICVAILVFILAGQFLAAVQSKNGFDLSNATIPVSEIRRGGPPRDGIPSIDQPKFVNAADVDWLENDDRVLAFKNRAYPLRILVRHEIVNDVVDGIPVAITYCPLCGTAMVFDRRYDGKTLTFGVSGLLYRSDVLMYDRQTDSLWSQLAMESVSGPFAGTELKWLYGQLMTWDAWKESNPGSQVLSRDTGFRRNYDRMPYAGYEKLPGTMFPVPHRRTELGNKEWVLGFFVNGQAMAVPIEKLAAAAPEPVRLQAGGTKVEIRYDEKSQQATVRQADGETLPAVHAYWFAWQAFYPETLLWNE